MDDLNAPLGLEREGVKPSGVGMSIKILGSVAVALVGAALLWTWLPQKPQIVASVVPENSKMPGKPTLRPTSQTPDKTLTTSDPQKPARLEQMEPSGTLEEPTISFINPGRNNSERLKHRPEPALLEKSNFGSIPRISKSGRKPMDAYARPSPGAGTARIAIVVGGLGLSQSGSKSAIEQLPGAITLAFAPYGNSLRRWMEKARRDGHELLMQVPMEPVGYPEVNPGKHTLTTSANAAQNRKNLHWVMGRMTNYVGMMNYLGAKLGGDADALQPVLEEIAKRGLLYLDDGSAFSSKAKPAAKNAGVPFLQGNIVIDDGRSDALIQKNLKALEKLARRRGHAIGVASAFPRSVKQIALWIKQAEKRGIEIVPVSALVR
jgi:polysaccharide deacetylase 2 family uncharacterized protein YibQ